MSIDNMNTKEAAEYLGINEKQVYALIKAGKIPCTRVTGKWIFPRKLIDDWIAISAQRSCSFEKTAITNDFGAILAAGSNDPVLDILINTIKHDSSGFYLFTSAIGSTEGLRLLGRGFTDIAWCHLSDPETGEYNIPSLLDLTGSRKIAIIHLFDRELGLVTAPSKKIDTSDFGILISDKLRFINRQKGSGTRILTDHHLNKSGIDPSIINGYDDEVFTHFEVGLKILSNAADVGVATRAIAKILSLTFVPLVRESFDMVLCHETFFKKEVQAFIDTLRSSEFRSQIEQLGNYDFSKSGKIIYSSI